MGLVQGYPVVPVHRVHPHLGFKAVPCGIMCSVRSRVFSDAPAAAWLAALVVGAWRGGGGWSGRQSAGGGRPAAPRALFGPPPPFGGAY